MTFRRHVRRYVTPTTLPLAEAKPIIRGILTDQRHAVIETTWDEGEDDWPPRHYVSVRYVTAGMRHGLAGSLWWDAVPAVVEFSASSGTREEGT